MSAWGGIRKSRTTGGSAAPLLTDAFDRVEETGERWFGAESHRRKCEIVLCLSEADKAEAERCFRKAILIRFEPVSRPAKRNCKLGVGQRSTKLLLRLSKDKWVPNGPSEQPWRKPGFGEGFRVHAGLAR